jgi:transglutaminase-like putative cysteine protease
LRVYLALIPLFAAGIVSASADVAPTPSASGPAVEIVQSHIDIEVKPDGSFDEANQVTYRILTQKGREALQKLSFSFTQGYQNIAVKSAYTLKADGTRIDVAPSGELYGRGATSAPGFDDLKSVTVVFPNVEVGDEISISTLFSQEVPWFKGEFAVGFDFSRQLVAHDVQISVTAPATGLPLFIDTRVLEGGQPQTEGSKTRRTWTYHNDAPLKPEPGAVAEADDGPHIVVSSFADFATVAHTYADLFQDKSAITPDIQKLADQLTTGITDRREQARVLYEWVSTHISYVAIVLGAGGFTPHHAADVLATRYGDCKDHVMLLDALLQAKGIASSAVLIDAGTAFHLSPVASPFLFNHLITYIPEFHLFTDSTARIAPFGILPLQDAGKPVVLVPTGEVTQTPSARPEGNSFRAISTVKIDASGNAEGDTKVETKGAAAIDARLLMSALQSANDGDYFRAVLGPGADGTLDRGDPSKLTPDYGYSAHYRMPNLITMPGPGALPAGVAYKPFYFTSFVAGENPPSRMRAFYCPSVQAEEDTTIVLPPGVKILSLPKSGQYNADEMKMSIGFDDAGHGTIHETVKLTIAHPQAVCSADYYNRARGDIAKMVSALKAQILYK